MPGLDPGICYSVLCNEMLGSGPGMTQRFNIPKQLAKVSA